MELNGTIAIVTGAGSGLGREIALGLAGAGAGVVIADLDPRAAEETARLVREHGVPARAVVTDIRDPEEAYRLVRLAGADGGPHILVNNAGGWTPGGQYPAALPEDWLATIALNLTIPMLLSQLVLEPMRELGGGAIVNIASSAGLGDDGYGSPEYAASKAGLIHLTKRMAMHLIQHRIATTAIAPGAFASEMNRDARDHADEVSARIPAGRIGTDEDMAGAAIFLASRAGDYVVGQTLVVDGGVTLGR